MKSMRKLWNKKLFLEGIRQTRIIGFVALLVYGILFLMRSFSNELQLLFEAGEEYHYSYLDLYGGIMECLGKSTALIYYIFVPMMMFILFGFLNSRKNSDYYHSLPIGRSTMYVTYYTVVLFWAVVMVAVCNGVSDIVVLLQGQHTTSIVAYKAGVFQWVYPYLYGVAGCILSMGAVSLGMNMTGTLPTNLAATIIILFVPRMVLNQLVATFYVIAPYLPESATFGKVVDSSYHILFDFLGSMEMALFGMESSETNPMIPIVYSTMLGLLYTVCGGVMFCRRKSETASRSGINPFCQHLLRITLTFACMLPAIAMIAQYIVPLEKAEINVADLCMWLVIGLIAYFGFEFFTTRKWKSAMESAKWLPVACLVVALACVGLSVGARTVSKHIPNHAHISQVRLLTMPEEMIDEEYYYVEEDPAKEALLGSVSITDPEAISLLHRQLEEEMALYRESAALYEEWCANPKYTVAFYENEKIIQRRLHFDPKEYAQISQYLEAAATKTYDYEPPLENVVPTYVDCYSYGVKFGERDRYQLYDSLKNELVELQFPASIYLGAEYNQTEALEHLNFYGEDSHWELPISVDTPKTLQLMIDTGNKRNSDFDFQWFTEYITQQENVRMATLELVLYTDENRGIEYEELSWYRKDKYDITNAQLQEINEILSAHKEKEVSVEENLLVVAYEDIDSLQYVEPAYHWYNITDDEAERIRELVSMDDSFEVYRGIYE